MDDVLPGIYCAFALAVLLVLVIRFKIQAFVALLVVSLGFGLVAGLAPLSLIKVINTVPNGQGQRGQGLALRNVRERLDLLHDVQGQFRCGLKAGVYQVRMEVPI